MTDDQHPLARLAGRGETRGPDAVLHAARSRAARRDRAVGPLGFAAAVAVVALAGAAMLGLRDDDTSSVRTADPTIDMRTPTTPPSDTPDTTGRPSTEAPTTTEEPPPTTVEAPTTTATTVPPDVAWEGYRAQLDGEVEADSGTVEAADGLHRVVGRTSGGVRSVDVARFDGRRWQTVASVDLPPPAYAFAAAGAIQVADVTGDGRPDVLVPLDAAQPIGVVLSDHGGGWRLLPVPAGDDAEPYLGVSPRIEAGRLVSDERSCDPSCAEGGTRTVVWRYVDGMLLRTT